LTGFCIRNTLLEKKDKIDTVDKTGSYHYIYFAVYLDSTARYHPLRSGTARVGIRLTHVHGTQVIILTKISGALSKFSLKPVSSLDPLNHLSICLGYCCPLVQCAWTAYPNWGDIFECCFKAQRSKIELSSIMQLFIFFISCNIAPSTPSNLFLKLINFFHAETHKVSTSIRGGFHVLLHKKP